ncbi:MAG: ATP-binding protein [Desulfohalobiaceae bacterium]
MQVKESHDLLQIRFSANLADVDQVCNLVQIFLQQNGLQQQGRFWVLLGLREALNNAVIHGCSQDQAQQIWLQIHFDAEKICIRVQDPGPGFDWHKALQRNVQETSEHGRGLCILRNYFHQVSFNPQGNQMKLEFWFSP